VLLWLRKFHRLESIGILAIGGVVLLIAGDVTARVIGAVLIVWAVVLVVLSRTKIFFMFSSSVGDDEDVRD
jgi:hypothetical protein